MRRRVGIAWRWPALCAGLLFLGAAAVTMPIASGEHGAAASGLDTVVHVLIGATMHADDVSPDALAAPSIGPLASPADALEVVARVRRRFGPTRAIAVDLGPGRWRLDRPLVIDARHGGTWSNPLIVRGAAGLASTLTGAVALEPLGSPDRQLTDTLPEAARSAASFFRLPKPLAALAGVGIERFHPIHAAPLPLALYDRRGALEPARWPNEGYAIALPPPEGETGRTMAVSGAPDGLLEGAHDAYVAGYLRYDWSFETLPLRRASGAVVSAVGPDRLRFAAAMPPRYGLGDGARFFLQHLPRALDRSGEWVRLADGAVAVLPRRGGGPIEAALADSLVVVERASHVRLEGLVLEHSRAEALRMAGATDVAFVHGLIRWTGGRGATIEGGTLCGIRSSVVVDTGDGGVWLVGGDRAGLTGSQHYLVDSVVMRFSRLGRTFKPAAYLDGVGQRLVGNYIAEGDHQAVYFQGNDHLISLNEITRVVRDTSDSGAIYTGRDWTAQGTVIRANYLHDIAPARTGFETKGIYLDDLASGITVTGNVFAGVPQAVFIGGGRDNRVEGNVFVSSSPALHLDSRGEDWAARSVQDPDGDLRRRLSAVPYHSPVWRMRYPALASLLDDEPGVAKRNRAAANLMLASEPLQLHPPVDLARQQFAPARRLAMPRGFGSDAAPVVLARELQRVLAQAELTGDELTAVGLSERTLTEMDRARALAPLVAIARGSSDLTERTPGE